MISGVDARNDRCRKTWQAILQRGITEILKDGRITRRHHAFLWDLYEEAFWYYQTGAGKDDDERVDMQMYLVGQQNALCYYPRTIAD